MSIFKIMVFSAALVAPTYKACAADDAEWRQQVVQSLKEGAIAGLFGVAASMARAAYLCDDSDQDFVYLCQKSGTDAAGAYLLTQEAWTFADIAVHAGRYGIVAGVVWGTGTYLGLRDGRPEEFDYDYY